jgi:hypothetical protein
MLDGRDKRENERVGSELGDTTHNKQSVLVKAWQWFLIHLLN